MTETLPRKCWKCGKELDETNTSPIVYMSDPPKYACVTCDMELVGPLTSESDSAITYLGKKPDWL